MRNAFGGCGRRRGCHRAAQGVVDLDIDLERPPHGIGRRLLDQMQVVVVQTLPDHRARNRELEGVVRERYRPDLGEPHDDGGVREIGSRTGHDARPGLAGLACSENATAMRIHKTFPQRWITHTGSCVVAAPLKDRRCRGDGGAHSSTADFPLARVRGGLGTLFDVKASGLVFVPSRPCPVYWVPAGRSRRLSSRHEERRTMAKGKRTYQPNNRRRARRHGFRLRMRTRAGRSIISSRRRKGRARLTPTH